MSALAEKLFRAGHVRMAGKILAAVMVGGILSYYCMTPELYAGQDQMTLLQSRRTYMIAAFSMLLIAGILIPNRLSDDMNRRLSWAWFCAAPFAVYFSLLYLNADKFNINFYELNRIALVFTFVFLYLVQGFLFCLTGSVRWAVILYAALIAVFGIANCFVISFRGMALSAADLFSVKTAMTVASQYSYELDWYMVMECLFTLAICTVSLKLRAVRMVRPAVRGLILAGCAVVTMGYYHICCKTDFLQRNDIRSEGFTHQLRYRQFDMIFTTLCTAFYLSVDKPDGYSLDRVKEIAEPYIRAARDEETSVAGDRTADASAGVKEIAEDGIIDTAVNEISRDAAADVKEIAEDGIIDTTVNEISRDAAAGVKEIAEDGIIDTAVNEITEDEAADAVLDVNNNKEAGIPAQAERPNLIVIMNESFADFTDIGSGLSLSDDCMPFIRSLTENTVKGNVYTSIFGANTPNSEYEFLTGNTMGFLPESSVGFHLFVRGDMPSMVSELKQSGYHTLAIHPYRRANYKRHQVYPQIGFDAYYSREHFKDPDYMRNYISDASAARRIIAEYEANIASGEPIFCYNVTVQNHGGYSPARASGVDDTVKVLDNGIDREKTELYLNLIRASDEMFRSLVYYFKQQETPTAILMFGDHQPNLGETLYEYLLGKPESECTPEELMEKYKVPFVLWTNYDMEEEVIEKTSLNYLYSIMAEQLKLPMTGYQEYLLDLSEEIPVLNAHGYWDSEGRFYELTDESSPYYKKIQEYNILEYNYILGGNDRYLPFFRSEAAG